MTMKRGERLSTDELLELLFKERSLERLLSREDFEFFDLTFGEYISMLCRKNGEVREHVILRANIEKSYGHQLFGGKRNPSRDTVIQLAFGFLADVEAAQTLLKVARKSPLYARVKRDCAIIYCLHNHLSVVETQIILHDLDLPVLGGSKNERD